MPELVILALVAAAVFLLIRRSATRGAGRATTSRVSIASIGFDRVPALHGVAVVWDWLKGIARGTDRDRSRDVVSIIDELPRDRAGLHAFVRRTTRTSPERADATIAFYMKRYSLSFEEACLRIVKDRELGR